MAESTEGGSAQHASEHSADPLDGWLDRPELRPLLRRLVAGGHPEAIAAAETEVAVARRLLEHDAAIQVEIRTPEGRHCDFEVRVAGLVAYLHLKRLRAEGGGRALRISPRLSTLERIERPLVVSVWWADGIGDRGMRQLTSRAVKFILAGHVGDEVLVRDDQGRELGGCRILAPSSRSTVTLLIGLPPGFHDRASRVQRLLRKAHSQFMPGAANAILICGADARDEHVVETALLGTHVERWDRFPPAGSRIAHGRADDGFWSGNHYAESRVAAWFRLADDGSMSDTRFWFRDPDEGPVGAMLREMLG